MKDHVIRSIVEFPFSTVLDFAGELGKCINDDSYGEIRLLSPMLGKKDRLIALGSSKGVKNKPLNLVEARRSSSYFEEFEINGCTLFVSLEKNFDQSFRGVLTSLIQATMTRLWSEEQSRIRKDIIRETVRSKDMNTFLHRLVRVVTEKYIKVEEMSAYTEDNIRQSLSLSATNHQIRGIQKKDIYYMLEEHSPITQCFNSGNFIASQPGKPIPVETWDQHFFSRKVDNQLIFPIQLPSDYKPERPSQLGVLRFSNFLYNGKAVSGYIITEFDLILAGFVSEVVFVLIQKYLQFQVHEQELSRLTHGLGANIDASLKFYDFCKEILFDESDDLYRIGRQRFRLEGESLVDSSDFANFFYDLGMFIDDLHFQFNNATAIASALDLSGTVRDFHSEVLMPTLRAAPSIAKLHNKRKDPRFSNFKAAGSRDLPRVHGHSEALVSVFRNLVDNSVKYNHNERALIDISFSTEADFVSINYSDNGIGIPDKERERVFLEGFRTKEARRQTMTGAGIGLSYSREILQAMKGDLICHPSSAGAKFEVRLKIEKDNMGR